MTNTQTMALKMPAPDGFDSQMRQETYYKDTLVEALRNVLEQAAKKFEGERVMVLLPCGRYTAEDIARAHRSTLAHCEKLLRAMIKEIPE